MKTYTLNEMADHFIGKVGTPLRDEVEMQLANDYADAERQHYVRIPATIYRRLKRKASSMGVSVSAYLRQTLASLL